MEQLNDYNYLCSQLFKNSSHLGHQHISYTVCYEDTCRIYRSKKEKYDYYPEGEERIKDILCIYNKENQKIESAINDIQEPITMHEDVQHMSLRNGQSYEVIETPLQEETDRALDSISKEARYKMDSSLIKLFYT